MTPEPDAPRPEGPPLPRLFLREPGWQVALKVGSDRVFCYMTNPGEDFYHRLLDGEIYLYRGEEKVCLPCASRQGLLVEEPRTLRPPNRGVDVGLPEDETDYGLAGE
jgi:hypothetical protein